MKNRAVRRNADGEWETVPHRSADKTDVDYEVPISQIRAVLGEHVFQEEPPPGLYPETPTVCLCGATPGSRPVEGDEAWWLDHVITVLTED